MFGTIRMHQEREYPNRVSATELHNPDFAALAVAYGAHGEVVTRPEEFAAAFERAQAAGRPALLEIRVDPDALTQARSLTEIREAALRSEEQTSELQSLIRISYTVFLLHKKRTHHNRC